MEEIVCPKCHSNQISANKKGYNTTAGVIGMATIGGMTGLSMGMIGSGKILITCLKCGNAFKAGDGTIRRVDTAGNETFEKQVFIDKEKILARRIGITCLILLLIIAIVILNFFNSVGKNRNSEYKAVPEVPTIATSVPPVNKVSKKNATKPPFYGTQHFNFEGGSGTGQSITIAKKRNGKGYTNTITLIAYPCCGEAPITEYVGEFANPFTSEGVTYRITKSYIEILNDDGTVQIGCMEDGSPCRSYF